MPPNAGPRSMSGHPQARSFRAEIMTFKRCGKRTVVLVEDLKKLLKELPDAKIPEQRGYRKRTAPPLAPPA